MNDTNPSNTVSSAGSSFPATMWTLVMKTRDDSDPQAQQKILDKLCRAYWTPLFHYAQRKGNPVEKAKDLTQGFFLNLLEKELFGKADREKGKLRTLLLTAFSFYIGNEHDKTIAQKRGGGELTLSLDWLDESGESYEIENADHATPETLYEKSCALATLMGAASSLEQKYVTAGKLPFFTSLRQFITVGGDAETYGIEAEKLGIRGDYYKVLVQRFRKEFKEALEENVRETLPEGATGDEVKEEIMYLIRLAYS